MDRLAQVRTGLLGVALALALILLGLDRYAAYAHRPTPESVRVAIYTTGWCGYCARLRQDLRASNIPYIEYDVEKTLQGQLGMWALRGRGVPVSAIGPEVVYGYQVQKIETALRALGHTFRPAPGSTPPSPSPEAKRTR